MNKRLKRFTKFWGTLLALIVCSNVSAQANNEEAKKFFRVSKSQVRIDKGNQLMEEHHSLDLLKGVQSSLRLNAKSQSSHGISRNQNDELFSDDFDGEKDQWRASQFGGHQCATGFGFIETDSIGLAASNDDFTGEALYASSYQGGQGCQFDMWVSGDKVAIGTFDSIEISFDFILSPWQVDTFKLYYNLNEKYYLDLMVAGGNTTLFPNPGSVLVYSYTTTIANPKEGNDSISAVFAYNGFDGNYLLIDNVKMTGKNAVNVGNGGQANGSSLFDPFYSDDVLRDSIAINDPFSWTYGCIGTLFDPGMDGEHSEDENEVHSIRVGSDNHITLGFKELEFKWDASLKIYAGSEVDEDNLLVEIDMYNSDDYLNEIMYIEESEVTFHWVSGSYEAAGFEINWICNEGPIAAFSGHSKIVEIDVPVQFTDISFGDNIASWEWTFEDANISTSYERNPTVVFNKVSFKSIVKLKVTDTDGNDNQVLGFVYPRLYSNSYELTNNTVTDCNGRVYDNFETRGKNVIFKIAPEGAAGIEFHLNKFEGVEHLGEYDKLFVYDGDYVQGDAEFLRGFSSYYSYSGDWTLYSKTGIITLLWQTVSTSYEDEDFGLDFTWTCTEGVNAEIAAPYLPGDYDYYDFNYWNFLIAHQLNDGVIELEPVTLFPDTNAYYIGTNFQKYNLGRLNRFANSFVQVFDPSSSLYNNLEYSYDDLPSRYQDFDKMIIDTVKLKYLYNRNSNEDVIDTLRVYIVDTAGLDFESLDIPYDKQTNAPENYLRSYDYLLDRYSTASMSEDFLGNEYLSFDDAGNIRVPIDEYHINRGEKLVIAATFIPGYEYKLGDTLFNNSFQKDLHSNMNHFQIATYKDMEGEDLYTLSIEDEKTYNMGGFINMDHWTLNEDNYVMANEYSDFYSDENIKEHMVLGCKMKFIAYSNFTIVDEDTTDLEASFIPYSSFEIETVNWDFGNGDTYSYNGDQGVSYTYLKSGEYNVCLETIGTEGQSITFCDQVTIDVGVSTGDEKMDEIVMMEFYPNPTADFLNVPQEIESFKVYDQTGKAYLEFVQPLANQVDLSNLNSGMYIIIGVQKDGKSFHSKIIKE